MSYTVHSFRRLLVPLLMTLLPLAFVAVVVARMDSTTFGWMVLAVATVLSLARLRHRTVLLRADNAGLTLTGRRSSWHEVTTVAVAETEVAVERHPDAPLPAWERAVVAEPGSGYAYHAHVPGLDVQRLAAVVRGAPAAGHVQLHTG